MITSQQMRELEDEAEAQGISSLQLMENAGKGFVEAVQQKYESQLEGRSVIIFAGTGNNAGDGFVAARYFAEEHHVLVLLYGSEKKLSEEAQRNYEKLVYPILVLNINTVDDLQQFQFQKTIPLLLVDALLGLGVKGEVREPISLGIDLFNKLKGIKVAVDLPSGLNPDTGELTEKHCDINSIDSIITFHDLKPGLEKYKKKTIVIDIGIPDQSLSSPRSKYQFSDHKSLNSNFPNHQSSNSPSSPLQHSNDHGSAADSEMIEDEDDIE